MVKKSFGALNMEAIKGMPMEMKLIYYYRYFSFILTSIFYLFVVSPLNYDFKLLVVVFLGIAAIVLNNIYLRHDSSSSLIAIMIVVETISNVVILIPTGGLNSPYFWYSLNTILLSAYFFSARFFYINLLTYLNSLTLISYLMFNQSGMDFTDFLLKSSNLILSMILISFAIQSLMKVTKKLKEDGKILASTNGELSQANKMIEESLEHIGALYQSVHNITTIKSEEKLIALITRYTREITKTKLAFACISNKMNNVIFDVDEEIGENTKEMILSNLEQNWSSRINSDKIFQFVIDDKNYMTVPIRSFHRGYGFLGIDLENKGSSIIEKEHKRQIRFLASLGAISLERFRNEEINELLLISEEQNRIANEMHDSVSQRLFFISSKVHSMIKSNENKNVSEMKSELIQVKDAMIIAMKDLRETIYSYSKRNGEATLFEKNISEYINDISKLHDVKITYKLTGSQERIGYDLKKAIYRILYEAIGNAIRHGKCNNITIDLSIKKDSMWLCIMDDGIGFDPESRMKSKHIGLGLKNLHNLTYNFDGEIAIDSQEYNGTSIQIKIPIHKSASKHGEVI